MNINEKIQERWPSLTSLLKAAIIIIVARAIESGFEMPVMISIVDAIFIAVYAEFIERTGRLL